MSSENELLTLARQLDSRGLAQIYDQFSADLYRYAMRLLGDSLIAEDCVAETFDRFLKALHNGHGPCNHLRAYLYRIAHNWITDFYRHEPPSSELDEDLPENDITPEENASHRAQLDTLKNAIRKLTPDQRQVIALKFWEGLDNQEIARAICKPVGAVKSLQHRALNALQRSLDERENS